MTTRAERLHQLIAAAFPGARVEIEDESHRHAGHAGASDAGETHYRVAVESAEFACLPRVERHRRVNAAVKPEFDTGLHALALDLKAPAP
jgi:BolA family transcriptional regulator, general stress-responsive regulator